MLYIVTDVLTGNQYRVEAINARQAQLIVTKRKGIAVKDTSVKESDRRLS